MGGFVVSSVLNGSIIAFSQKISLTQGILSLLTAKVGERAQFSFDIQSVLVFTRNFIIPLFRNYTILVVILAFLSLVKLYSINKKMFILSFLWIAPSLIANQWWDSVLFGRHSLIAGFGLALLAAYIIKNNKIAFSVLILYLLIASLATMSLLRGKIPYLREAKAIEELPKGGILIESHFARPQVDKLYKGKVVFVDEPRWEKEKLGDLIEETLIHKKNVFITAQALSEPYGLYSGPYLHILSLSYRNKFILKDIVEKFTLKEYRVINRNDNLIFYKVISSISSPYPLIESLKFHRRRIDFFDLFTQVWFIYAK